MSRDYAARRPYPKARVQSPRRVLTIVTSFLCGYLVASVFDLNSLMTWTRQLYPKANPETVVAETKAQVPLPKPKLEFYTLLSKDNNKPPMAPQDLVRSAQLSKTEIPAASLSTAPPAQNADETYQLQVASFNKREDAEHLKASLVLGGFEATIATIEKQKVLWYRVSIGPFPSRAAAQKAQTVVLQNEHMQGILRRV
jgi:cell division protein FtsN